MSLAISFIFFYFLPFYFSPLPLFSLPNARHGASAAMPSGDVFYLADMCSGHSFS
jgi:hypothetical protein